MFDDHCTQAILTKSPRKKHGPGDEEQLLGDDAPEFMLLYISFGVRLDSKVTINNISHKVSSDTFYTAFESLASFSTSRTCPHLTNYRNCSQ